MIYYSSNLCVCDIFRHFWTNIRAMNTQNMFNYVDKYGLALDVLARLFQKNSEKCLEISQ